MSKTMRQKVLACLKTLQKEGPRSKGCGICSNLDDLMYQNFNIYSSGYSTLLQKAWARWPKFSGDRSYPIPGTTRLSASERYIVRGNLWVGAYGKLRKELLAFLIDQLEPKRKEKP